MAEHIPCETTSDLSILEPDLRGVIALLPSTNETATNADTVVRFMRAIPPRPHDDPDITKIDIMVSVPDADPDQPATALRVYIPRQAAPHDLLPVLLWSASSVSTSFVSSILIHSCESRQHHGGFFSMGPLRLDPFCSAIAIAAGIVVVAPAYRQTPENPFPAPFNDAYQVLLWLTQSEQVRHYSIDPTRIAIGGTSAGATITAGMFLRYRDEGKDVSRIRLLILEDGSYTNKSTSYSTFHNPINKLWNANVTRFMWEMYLPQGITHLEQPTLGYAVPALANDLSQFPPTMVLCAQWDDLTNDAIAFAHRLLESGVATEIHQMIMPSTWVIGTVLASGPPQLARKETPFSPPEVTIAQLHAAVPKHLFKKSTAKGLYYVFRDVACAVIAYKLGTMINPFATFLLREGWNALLVRALKYSLWATYWHWQGVILAGWWCLGHEAGHGTLSPHGWLNHALGFSLHTFLLVPYYAWRSSHHAHHKATGSIERDENYVPRTRSDYGLPPPQKAHARDYHEIFEETPIYTLLRMLLMQSLGWQYYLVANAMGSPMYPKGTNHFFPSSPLFKPHERNGIIASNIGLAIMSTILYIYTRQVGLGAFVKLYFIPYLLANHWIVMLTYLHHSDPTIPHFRRKEWTFVKGALATVDRPLLGWAGRFFLHNVSHDHIGHHLFSSIPFYNQPEVTELIKKVLKEDYNYDSTNTFRALYRTFTQCCFIEDDGDIVFYKNKDGEAARVLASDIAKN
ncbi:hypothetical protein ONZ45_g5620 [Pleurotus djamor]|nr:hypothetical protein ONZ45_g5620 [Pleurotus djamor]